MVTIKRLPEFDTWFEGLRDRMTSICLGMRLDELQRGILGDMKPVGDSLFEMREFFGPGRPMYSVQQGAVLIVMLGGGDKSNQASDIATAKKLAATLVFKE